MKLKDLSEEYRLLQININDAFEAIDEFAFANAKLGAECRLDYIMSELSKQKFGRVISLSEGWSSDEQ